MMSAHAQSTAALSGTVLDPKGSVLPGANVIARNDATHTTTRRVATDAQGHFTISGLPAGVYIVEVSKVEVSAFGFGDDSRGGIQLAEGASQEISFSLSLGNVTQEVTVEAANAGSLAAQYAPMDGLIEARSTRTEISTA